EAKIRSSCPDCENEITRIFLAELLSSGFWLVMRTSPRTIAESENPRRPKTAKTELVYAAQIAPSTLFLAAKLVLPTFRSKLRGWSVGLEFAALSCNDEGMVCRIEDRIADRLVSTAA